MTLTTKTSSFVCLMIAATAVATPVFAATGPPARERTAVAITAKSQDLPPLDDAKLRGSISELPDENVTSAQVRVSGSAGHWSGRSGVRDVKSDRPVPPDGRFRIASATKMFTATLVLQLCAEHRLDLHQSVQHYLPNLLPTSYPRITVGQLLDHTSGLPTSQEDAGDDDPAWFVAHRLDYWTPRQILETAVSQPMVFAPGTQQQYNGANYFVAGLLIEKVTGRTYGYELANRILRPLQLHDTYLPPPTDNSIDGPHAHGYVRVDGSLVDITKQSPRGWAESGLVSTTRDLTQFMTALYRGRLLPPVQLAHMFTVPDVPYTGTNSGCAHGPQAGHACLSMGMERTALPGGVTVWGKSGGQVGYTTAAFATRDTSRIMTFSLTTTGNRDGSESERVQAIAGATFIP